MNTALTIAGFDPTSGAGVTADIKVFSALKVYGIGVVSALTAQNTFGVKRIEPLHKTSVRHQIDTLLEDFSPDATKTGMIYEKSVIRLVCSEIDAGRIRNVVVDPVITSTSGKLLIKKDAVRSLANDLIPRALLVTPNIPEAESITGFSIRNIEDMQKAAEKIRTLGPKTVLIKGGHLQDEAVDVLFDGNKHYKYKGKKLKGWYHGTGCCLSAAITANLALEKPMRDGVKRSKAFVKKAIEKSISLGKGMNLLSI